MSTLRNLALFALLSGGCIVQSSPVLAQWLEYTAGSQANQPLIGSFAGGSGAYSGNVAVRSVVTNDGGNNGVPGILGGNFSSLTPTFLSHYPTNFGSLTSLSLTYNHTRDAYGVTIDFSGLQNGYLPSGTTMALLDMDIEEQMQNVIAFNASNAVITAPWLSQYSGMKGSLDYNNSDGDQGGLLNPPLGIEVGGKYNFTGISTNQTSSLLGFVTTSDIRRITFDVSKYSFDGYDHVGGFGLAIGSTPVPEPGTYALLAAGLLSGGMILRRRRKSA